MKYESSCESRESSIALMMCGSSGMTAATFDLSASPPRRLQLATGHTRVLAASSFLPRLPHLIPATDDVVLRAVLAWSSVSTWHILLRST